MPKKKEPELSPEEQSRRFKAAAREAELTESEVVFEEAFKKIARPHEQSRRTASKKR